MKMFGFVKKAFFVGLTILSSVNLLTVTALRCISTTNQECKVRPEIINVNSDEPIFYPFSIKTSKCSGRIICTCEIRILYKLHIDFL